MNFIERQTGSILKVDVSNIIRWIIILWTLSGASPHLSAEDWIQQSIDFTINTKFDEAGSLIDNRLQSGHEGIEEYFYYATVLNSKMTHMENLDDEATFLNVVSKAIDMGNRMLTDSVGMPPERLAQIHFYRGSSFGYRAFFYGQTGKWLSAAEDGLKAVDDLNQCIRLDSTIYDAYLGTGIIKYWQSTKLKYVLWLPFVEDRRLEGISEIKKAIGRGRYTRFSAMHQLIYILLDNGQFDAALAYADTVITAYPASPFMRWAHAHAFFKSRRYPEAIQSFLKLLELIEKNPKANPSHWLFCQVRLAEIYDRTGDGIACVERCRLALSRAYPQTDQSRVIERLDKARELLKKYKIPEQPGLVKLPGKTSGAR